VAVNDRFLRACRREPVDVTPVWFMRQAGRYMPEYRALRARYSMLDLCRSPELATEVTLQPVTRIRVDAAILFSDLLLPLAPLGVPFSFDGDGPVIERPIRSEDDIRRLRAFDPREELGHVLEAIRLVRRELDGKVPLIGFAGAPFTLASYAIEGGHSTQYAETKRLMYGHPRAWHDLAGRLAALVVDYLAAQVEAGAQAVQVFDSWVGALGRSDYREFVLPHMTRIFDRLAPLGVPAIHFGTGTAPFLDLLRQAGGDVIGADWRLPLDDAWSRIGFDRGIQGNLDPALLLGPRDRLLAATRDVLERAGGRPGHIFNLGHGILPSTAVEQVQAVVEAVHALPGSALGARTGGAATSVGTGHEPER
jgi:uroporphyrinogen decarboxylase